MEVASLYAEKDTYVIGGAKLFSLALSHPRCTRVIISLLGVDYTCDTFIDPAPFSNWYYEDTHFVSYYVREYKKL